MYHYVVEPPVMGREIISPFSSLPVGLKPGAPACGDCYQVTHVSPGAGAEHACSVRQTGRALLGLGVVALPVEMMGNRTVLAVGLQFLLCPVGWLCLVLGILSSLLPVCGVQSVEARGLSLFCTQAQVPTPL